MANANYSLFLIIFFIFIFFTFIMPKIDLYNKKYIDNIIPLITNTSTQTHTLSPTQPTSYITQTLPSTQTLSPIQSLPVLNSNINSDPTQTTSYITQTLPPIQTLPVLNSNIKSDPIGSISTFITRPDYSNIINERDLPQPNPIPIDNFKTIEHLDNTFPDNMKLDLNSCSQSCCKHTQWLPPFINNNNNTSEYIGSNFSCNLGNGSGCVCYTQKNSNFLGNRGISN